MVRLTGCADHDAPAVGSCPTCGRRACNLCLGAATPADFECPGCGERGVVLFDQDLTDLVNDVREPRRDPGL